jgi:hypothetical protein
MSALLDLVRTRRAELQKSRRRAKWHYLGQIEVGPVAGTQHPGFGFGIGGAGYSPAQQRLIDTETQARIAALKATGAWREGDHSIVHVIMQPSIEQQERGPRSAA